MKPVRYGCILLITCIVNTGFGQISSGLGSLPRLDLFSGSPNQEQRDRTFSEVPFQMTDVISESSLVPNKATGYSESSAPPDCPDCFEPKTAVNYPERDRVLKQVLNLLKRDPDLRLKINGYADEFRFEQTNKDVSRNRAGYLASYLRNNGVPREVIVHAEGKGSQTNNVPKHRVEIVIEH